MQDSSDSRHCKKCTKPDEADNMVGCDACNAWEHYGCAGVSDSIADSNRSWKCESCKRPAQITSAPESSVSAYTSASSKKSRQAQLRLELLEQQNQVRMRKLEEEERYLKEKFEILMQFEEEDEIISNRSKVSARSKQERLENWLRQDNTPISDGEYEIPHGVEKGRGDPEILKSVIEEQPVAIPALEIKSVPRKLENRVPIESALKVVPTPTPRKTTTIITSRTSNTYPTVPAFGSATVPTVQYFGHLPSNKILKPSEPSTNVWNVSSTETVEPAVCKNTTLKISTVPTGVETSGSHQNKFQRSNHQMPELDPISFSQGCQKTSGPFTADSRSQFPSPGLKPENYHLEPVASGPTTSQLAARQVMPKDLPIFSGDPEDWPMFYSSFKNSTQVCGYSDAENLARLQRCLRGSALDSVRSRLLLPSSVGSVISTLQMLYGRPEILINSLLRRVRSTQAPKADNLKSIVDYGLAVQNLIDHMIISQQQNHLENPLLLNELVEKLPTNFKLQWSSYKQGQVNINLATFNGFVSNLVYLASDLLVTSDSYHTNLKGHRSEKQKEKLFVHAQDPTHESDDEAQSSGTTSQDRLNKPCSYCDVNGHYIVNCQPFKALTVDARWKAIRSKNLCRTCLVPHRRWPCRSKRECELEGCRARHHQLLHAPQLDPVATATSSDMPVHQNHHQSHSIFLFRYLPVKLFANGKVVKIFAFLDEGSSSTLLEAEVAKQLDMDRPSSSLWLSWTGNISREEKGSKCVSLTIAGERSLQKYTIDNVLTVDELNLPKQSFNYESLATQHPHMVGLPLQSYSNVVPRMIIGLEHARLLTSLKTREGAHEGPVVVKTRLGWCAFGKESGMTHISEQLNFHNTVTNQSLHDIMKCYFAVEESAVSLRPEAEEDKRALHILQKTTVRQGNRYETGLLWRIDNPTFPDSLSMAKSRLKSLEKRMQCDPELADNVQGQIDSYVRKGYAHKATPEELQRTDARHVWYLPLGVVVSPKKPEKIRLIWDAAAKVQGVSLNDLLLKGPDLHVSLITVILRFRERNIAVCGDICEMFHQIRIRAEDRQYQRFLWRSNSTEDIDVYVMDVATFGATCSPCSAQYIKNKNAEEHSKVYPRAARAIIENHYVDDFLDSTDTVEEAVQLVEQVKAIHASAGFEIKKFKSNYSEVLNTIGETDTSTGKPINADKQGSTDRVLGLVWDPVKDTFTFDVSCLNNQSLLNGCITPTKRQVLQLIMRLFDPLGLISHYIVHGKIIMQEIWRSGTNWDEPIAESLLDMWFRWVELLPQINEVQVSRCFFGDTSSNSLQELQVHVFVDASESAYACVAYVRLYCSGETRCAFVASKTKVAPLKPLSIPRLELQAAMIGSRLIQSICTSMTLPITKRYLWTDSSTVLAWLRSDSRRYHQFIGFRVGEILSLTSIDEWRYVPSGLNVADEATKWSSGPTFSPNNRWFSGPEFLLQNESKWPTEIATSAHITTNEELRPVFLHRCNVMTPLVDVARFSNWERLVRATAYVHRAISILRKRFSSEKKTMLLQSEEIQNAEFTIWRQAQTEAFPDEIAAMMNRGMIDKSSPLYRLNPFLDDNGIIRMGSRIEAAPEATFSTKYPVILPNKHSITALITDSFHRRLLHGNNETVNNEMRQMFYIVGLRNLIRKVAR